MGEEENDLGEEEGSLAEFEEEFLKEKKKKSNRLLYFLLLLLVLLGTGYYFGEKKGLLPESITDLVGDPSSDEEAPKGEEESKEFQEDEIQLEEKSEKPDGEEAAVVERIEPKKDDSKKAKKSYGSGVHTFHVGVYAEKKNVDMMVAKLEKAGLKPETKPVKIKADMVRVLVGHYPFREIAMKAADDLIQRGFKPRVQIVKAGEYALVMGSFPKRQDASELINSLEDKGLTVWTDNTKSETAKISATLVEIKGVRGPMVEKVIDFLERKEIEYVLKR